jgi:cobalt-zinc-cadmium efflux system outer membrane protein
MAESRCRYRYRLESPAFVLELQVRIQWVVVSLTLLAPAMAGCQTASPTRTVNSCPLRPVLPVSDAQATRSATSPAPTATESTATNEIMLTSHQDDESVSDPLSASKPSALTLADLEGIALENNPTLATATARMNSARGRQVQAGLYPNPVIGYHATEIGNLGTAGQQGGFIGQRFITAGKLRLDQAIAGKQVDESHFRFHAQEQRVLSDVRVRFYDALVARKRVQLTQELARIGDELVASSKKLKEGGQISPNDLLQAEIEAEQSHILLDNARNQNSEEWRRLVAVIGMPAMEPTTLTGELDADIQHYDWEECYSLVLADNPELIAAQARVDRARISTTRARKENIPNIDLFVSVRHHNVTESDVANVQVGIPIPIFDANQGNIQSAYSELIAAENSVKRIELDLQDRLAVAYRRYSNARQQVDRYTKRILPRAQESLDLVTDGYKKGQVVGYLTLITAQRTYIQVNLAHLDATRELRESTVVIEGQLLTESLSNRE